jgi:AraC-like DNA-binding protein
VEEIAVNAATQHRVDRFLETLRNRGEFESLFDHLPEVCFFVKDSRSRLMMGNQALLRLLRQGSFERVVGRTGSHFFPKGIAESFHADDQRVLQGGKSIFERVELMLDEDGNVSWFCTTKLPLYGRDGRVVGLKGVTRKLGKAHPQLHPFTRMMPAIDIICQAYRGSINLNRLASACHLSPSQFRRNFNKLFGMSPLQFVLNVRLQAAADLLRSSRLNVTEIAMECGFNEPNYFARQFHRHIGVTPSEYRRHGEMST